MGHPLYIVLETYAVDLLNLVYNNNVYDLLYGMWSQLQTLFEKSDSSTKHIQMTLCGKKK